MLNKCIRIWWERLDMLPWHYTSTILVLGQAAKLNSRSGAIWVMCNNTTGRVTVYDVSCYNMIFDMRQVVMQYDYMYDVMIFELTACGKMFLHVQCTSMLMEGGTLPCTPYRRSRKLYWGHRRPIHCIAVQCYKVQCNIVECSVVQFSASSVVQFSAEQCRWSTCVAEAASLSSRMDTTKYSGLDKNRGGRGSQQLVADNSWQLGEVSKIKE